MLQISAARLYEDNREKLGLIPVAGEPRHDVEIHRDVGDAEALVGRLNLIHPNRIQVLGRREAGVAESAGRRGEEDLAALLQPPAAVIILCDGVQPGAPLARAAQARGVAVLATPLHDDKVIDSLRHYLSRTLAESTERHGVCMDVLGLGVLITGDSGVGKSELGLELVSRGHGLVADDVVEIARISSRVLECRSPGMLKDFLEVRGLGVLNIRTIFGETAVRPKMNLRLLVHLERPAPPQGIAAERLPLHELSEDILGVTVRKVVIPVAAGRNLAVLLEAAVRNHILELRGIFSTKEFIARQQAEIRRDGA